MKILQALGLGLLVLGSMTVHAQTSLNSVEPYEEFGKKLRAAQEVSPLTSDLFGDRVSLYNGASEFDVTDITIPGNGNLPVQLSRRLVIEDRRKDPGNIAGMGDWDLDVPYIEGTFTQQNGWTIGTDTNLSYARCSDQRPPDVYVLPSIIEGYYPQIWGGNHIHVPGRTDDELLKNTEAKLPAVADGNSYPWVTKSFYRLSCLSSTANGYPGEAFVAISPSGERYTFNWAVVHVAPPLKLGKQLFVNRSRIFLLATRVEDRFGNWVAYTYSGDHLTTITSSDGRVINIGWSGNTVLSASVGSRTWNYGYTNGALSSVAQPDGSRWTYTPTSGSMVTIKGGFPDDYVPPNGHCQLEMDPNTGDFVYSVGSPSGATGTFHFSYVRHYRGGVPFSCADGNPYHLYPNVYNFFDNFALVSKQIAGAALPATSWSYNYGGDYYAYYLPSAPGPYDYHTETYIPPGTCGGCAVSKTVTVTGPGDITKYSFGVQYARNEGQLLQTEVDALSGAVAKTVTNTYLDESQVANQAFPDNAGQSILPTFINPMVGRIRPVVSMVTVQDGDTYTRQTEAFDALAQLTKVRRFNNIAGQSAIEEQTTYLNDLPHWLLGLPQEVDNLTTGEVENRNTYDPSTVTLQSRARFGQTLMSYTFDTGGNLASFTDGNNHTTTLSNYKRGVPQSITYPNTWFQTLAVDDFGQITAVTDQAGAVTSYAYDTIGRIAQITYPTGDEQAWYPKTFSYTYVGAIERGVDAGHWRRTVTTGSAQSVTYFDALLRPVLSDSYIGNNSSDATVLSNYDWEGKKAFGSYVQDAQINFTNSPGNVGILGTRSSYDTLGRLVQSQQDSELAAPSKVLSTATEYLFGARVQVTDPKASVTTTSYQVFDEPSYGAVTQVQAPAGITQTITRDPYGDPLAITQSGQYNGTGVSVTKTLTYDSYHRLCRTTEPESGSEVMDYDGANNIAWSAAGLTVTGSGCGQDQVATAGRTVRTYGPLNAVLTITPPAGTQSTHFNYDKLSQLKSAYSGPTTWTATRNKRGMLTAETLQSSGQSVLTLRYAHDAYGSLRQLTYPDGEVVTYSPDPLGRPTQVGAYLSGISYFPEGDVASYTYGNGAGYLASKNTRRLLSNFTVGQGSTLKLSEDLGYDQDANITQTTDLAGGPRTKGFGYDALNRLTSAQAKALWGTESYTYDPLNNIRTRVGNGQTSIYNYDPANRLASVTGASTSSFQYDNRGNVTNKNGAVLSFDQQNQLTQITGYDSYSYDAFGRRTQKTPAGGSPIYYFYNQAGQLLYQWDTATQRTTNFIYLGTKLVARDSSLKVPDAPTSLSVPASSNDGTAALSWVTSTLATRYVLEQSSNGGTSWASVYDGSGTSTALSGLAAGSYTYHVAACDSYGCSGSTSGSATLVVTYPPTSAPTLSAPANNTSGSYTVSWSGVPGQVSYTLQEQLNGGGWATVQTTGTTSWDASGHGNGTYGYHVQACNAGGCGPWSAVASTSVLLPPPAPSSISVPASSNGPIAISWAASATATIYGLDQSANGGAWGQIYASSATSMSLTVGAAGTYSYRAYACNASGCSGYTSGSVSVTGPGLSVPGSSNSGSYTVSWNGTSGATSYTLQEQINGGGWTTVQATGAINWGTSGRSNGTYGYHVQACNTGGCGPWSGVGTITVALPPPMPASVTAPSYVHGVQYYITWPATATATLYNVQRTNDTGTTSIVASTSATSATMPAPTMSQFLQYAVQACNAAGCSAVRYAPNGTQTDPPGPIR